MPDSTHVLSFKPSISEFGFGSHDASAAIFRDSELLFAAEEERYTRKKHATNQFPEHAINECLEQAGCQMDDIDLIRLTYDPRLVKKNLAHELSPRQFKHRSQLHTLNGWEEQVKYTFARYKLAKREVKSKLKDRYEDVPPIELREHHRCHAISAFHYSGYDEALVLTIDGSGTHDSTVVWTGDEDGVTRERTYNVPNSIGRFYGAVTEFLGFRRNNGEGKVMGLAPYGSQNETIESKLRSVIETGVDYDVSRITKYPGSGRISELEEILGHSRKRTSTTSFTDWEKDLAYTTQRLTEEICVDITEYYLDEFDLSNVCLAGGVALNCKMNKCIMEHPAVQSLFIQPVAHDGGLPLGGGLIETPPAEVPDMAHVYYGTEISDDAIESELEKNKIDYRQSDDVAKEVARALADGKIVARCSGAMELGPRALGNRSILADPRSAESRDRVNKYVKHREEWRPFAPSMLEEAVSEYLVNPEPSPYMIKTFDVRPEKRSEIEAVLHPADETTRPQTVNEEQNPEYYRIISEFENLTGVPVVLNTSFNDHGEPIVRTPAEAIKDFYGMGIDMLVMNEYIRYFPNAAS